jgi:nicotinate-nucleotide adenylyltransferase
MLLLALAGVEGLEPCFIEGDLPTPSYTIDTVRLLQSDSAGDSDYYFIIGVDAFADLLSWKSYAELLQRVVLVVARRRGFSETEKLTAIAQAFGYTLKPGLWQGTGGFRDIYFLKSSPVEISSSQIRDRLAEGCRKIPGVNPAVVDYAERHKLYGRGG